MQCSDGASITRMHQLRQDYSTQSPCHHRNELNFRLISRSRSVPRNRCVKLTDSQQRIQSHSYLQLYAPRGHRKALRQPLPRPDRGRVTTTVSNPPRSGRTRPPYRPDAPTNRPRNMSRSFVSGTNSKPDHGRPSRDHHRIPQPEIDTAVLRVHREHRRRQQAAEPAVADMIRQRHRRVADARREQLDQRGRHRPVDHRHQHHQEDQSQHHRERLRPEDVPGLRKSSPPTGWTPPDSRPRSASTPDPWQSSSPSGPASCRRSCTLAGVPGAASSCEYVTERPGQRALRDVAAVDEFGQCRSG